VGNQSVTSTSKQSTMTSKKNAPATTIDYDQVGAVSSQHLATGKIIAKKFRLLELLGRGGMGQVWKAEYIAAQKDEGEDVPFYALKFVPDDVQSNRNAMDKVRQSYKKTAGLKHQNICTLHPLEKDDNLGWVLVMEYVPGVTLREYVKRNKKLAPEEVIRLLKPIANALDSAHIKKLVHRDIKPDNIMVMPDGEPQIIDFGLAAQIRNSMSIESWKQSIEGTAPYMAPEQWQNDRLNAQTDLYALGVVAYELLSGVLPFKATNPMALGYQAVTKPMPPIAKMGNSVNEVLNKAMAKKQMNRFDNCQQFIDALADALKQIGVDEYNATKTIGEDGRTLLRKAAELGEVDGIRFLISQGADVNAKDNNGNTPLHEILKNLSYYLSFREREIIKLRYGFEGGYTYTPEEVGHIFQVTSERIRQIEKKAIAKLGGITNLTTEQMVDVFRSYAKNFTIENDREE